VSVTLVVTVATRGTAMNHLLIVQLHRIRYDEFLRQATERRREPRRRRGGRHCPR
jgi:hypothetical protein